MNGPVVMLAGPRDLPPGVADIAPVVSALVAAGVRLVTGCAKGADALVIRSALGLGSVGVSALEVLAAHGPVSSSLTVARYSAPGAWSGSALEDVAAAVSAGVSVTWWAGGGPDLVLRARLARRSRAGIQRVAAGGPGSGLVAWPMVLPPRPFGSGAWPSCGSGTWSSIAAAARLGLPVVVVPVGNLHNLSPSVWPDLGARGHWSRLTSPVLAGAALWSPAPELDLSV
ncbi:MAG: hypothetical protein EOM10_16300 [Opitutae bacterium]|nr:hypothetical protein [Opitutae bacterium]